MQVPRSWPRFHLIRRGSACARPRKGCRPRPELARGHGWPPVRSVGVSGRKGTTVSTAQIVDPAVAGTALTTSSLGRLLDPDFSVAKPGAGASGQSENADETFGILLVVARAHRERRKIGAI